MVISSARQTERAEEFVSMTLWDLDGVKTHLMDYLQTMSICIDSCSYRTSLCPGTLWDGEVAVLQSSFWPINTHQVSNQSSLLHHYHLELNPAIGVIKMVLVNKLFLSIVLHNLPLGLDLSDLVYPWPSVGS